MACEYKKQRGKKYLLAYYYSFDETGVEEIDNVLAAVAWAGKAYHNTSDWNDTDIEETSVADQIQAAAGDAAAKFKGLCAALESLKHSDGCYCEAAFSGPGCHPAHSPECIAARDAIGETP